ncbi:MAG TPA: hypothetical protein VJ583_05660 [Nitrososphaeraceae archaeon]|nr:hypothetical protein [Nitrososphaeraceae archaeon]
MSQSLNIYNSIEDVKHRMKSYNNFKFYKDQKYIMKVEKTKTCFRLNQNLNGLKPISHDKNYTLRYFYNPNEIFFHLFMHTKVYDKRTFENIEKQGILLRSWNPITRYGERYFFKKGEEGQGDDDLNVKRVHLPNTKTIFEFSSSTKEDINDKESFKLAEEIIAVCPHKDIEVKITNS